ncbi:heme utilization protein HutZ [Marinobacterium nitratireducens]|uniref:Heme utilization protein HutZ n=1 Tax=Marinobacterium nitratireducens TaxID=518897 RepID=A0A917ZLX7_9GAMM|nr:pyridoxamine 5'-phosphate oxidase family protein [Marinobacterium nitratireducens]GGO84707.1 heme utilization protein HutZ [Marinobacterium nitratireducens]
MKHLGPAASATETDESAALLIEVREFIASRSTLNLATLTPDGKPHASTAPFLAFDGCFFLLLSGLSAHAVNLRTHPQASILLQADECESHQPFARLRLGFEVQALPVGRDEARWRFCTEKMRQRFGAIIDQLTQLPDFTLFELRPAAGRYVKGFGRAYELDAAETRQVVGQD